MISIYKWHDFDWYANVSLKKPTACIIPHYTRIKMIEFYYLIKKLKPNSLRTILLNDKISLCILELLTIFVNLHNEIEKKTDIICSSWDEFEK